MFFIEFTYNPHNLTGIQYYIPFNFRLNNLTVPNLFDFRKKHLIFLNFS